MGQSLPTPALRPLMPDDAPLMAAIFCASIEELAADDYSEAQRAAWMEAADDAQAFAARLAGQLTLVGTLAGSPVGFVSLKGNDHIDMLFVHPSAAGQGVGSTLCDAAEKLATARGVARLTVDASDNARDFFVKRGYAPDRRNMVPVGDEWLGNTSMHKVLAASPAQDRPQ
jgi:putative acetyltransferase